MDSRLRELLPFQMPQPDSLSSPVQVIVGGLAVVGFCYTSYLLFSFIRLLLSVFVLPGASVSLKPFLSIRQSPSLTRSEQLRKFGPKGSWALVTGASDGIGKEFALQLARAGYNILLVSRTESKLAALASEITSKYSSTQTKTLAMDFAQNRDSDYARLEDSIDGIDIAVLINNVGKSHNMPVPFAETPEDEMMDIITINCFGTLRVTQLVLPGMIQRRRGLVLTMGSFGGLLPSPLLATYSGSKAFLQQWSTALGAEVASKGITVELVPAYLVTSAMSKIRRPTMLVPNPRGFVSSVLKSLGRSGGAQSIAYTSVPYWSHAIMAWGLTTLVGTMGKLPLGINKSMHEGIRKRALKKLEREKGKKAA